MGNKSIKIDKTDSDGDTKLTNAARDGDIEKCRRLIDKGANIDYQNKWGLTPLHLAAYKGHLEVVKFLMKMGAKLDVYSHIDTAQHIAANERHWDVVDYICANGGMWIPEFLERDNRVVNEQLN